MKGTITAYLVAHHDEGFGNSYPLDGENRFSLGRAPANAIVVQDELCSREHAEVFFYDGQWRIRDLNSLNGTRLNGEPVTSDSPLHVGDQIEIGRSRFLFVESLDQLPDVNRDEGESDNGDYRYRKWLSQTRFLTPETPADDGRDDSSYASLARSLSLLYRLGLDMGSAESEADLALIVLNGLLEAIPADVGAILNLTEGRNLELVAYRHRDPSVQKYHRVSQFLSNEVLSRREAVLAADVSQRRDLDERESLTDIGARSIICAPVISGEKVLGLIHLYTLDDHKNLSSDDLEFTMAVAKHYGTTIRKIREHESLSAANQALREQLRVDNEIVGTSEPIQQILSQIQRVAETNATVLVRGESGVGKELVARAIHFSSPRRNKPFVCLNCAAITETLLESELFGHEKGAFTGATEQKVGKFEAADGGTIFLDEIGEMSITTQAKLLRILEGHPFERVGGSKPIRVDVRVVAATNQPLEENIKRGTFRKDLFYRLQVVEIRVPPLRERRDDILVLAEHFLQRFIAETGRKITGFTDAAKEKLQTYAWPGNVRELRNVVERAVALNRGDQIDVEDLWLPESREHPPTAPRDAETSEFHPCSLQEVEKIHIERTLQHTKWNKSRAASILGIERSTLDRKLKQYKILRPAEL